MPVLGAFMRRGLSAVVLAVATGLTTVVAVAGPAATATAGAAGDSSTMNFDAVVTLTGTYGQYGQYQLAGDKAMVAQINKEGGVMGKKIAFHYLDAQSNASIVALDTQQLLEQYPATFMDVGTVTATCAPGLPVTTKEKVITFCTDTDIDFSKYPYAFQLIPTTADMAKAEDSGLAHLGVKKIAAISDEVPGDLQGTKLVTDNAPKYGMQSVAYVSTPTGATDYTAALQQAKNAGAQAIDLHAVVPSSVISCLRDLQTLGWDTVKIQVNDESIGTAVMEHIPSAVAKQFYVVAPRIYLSTKKASTPLSEAFAKQLTSQGPIGDIGISAYHADAVNLAAYAMKTAKTTTNVTKLLDALEATGKTDIPRGTFLDYQNPGYTKTEDALPTSAMTNYWAVLRPGTPVTGHYEGVPITVTSSTK